MVIWYLGTLKKMQQSEDWLGGCAFGNVNNHIFTLWQLEF